MALLDPLHPLQSAIVETLAVLHPLTMRELHRKLHNEHHIQVSTQNLYRAVSQLVAAQVLVREYRALSLNRIWISHFMTLAASLKHQYSPALSGSSKLPGRSGEVREYSAGSLALLDPLWSDALVELADECKGKPLYAYNSHPWYSIGMRDTEQRAMHGLVSRGVHVYMLYGNETFLDVYANRLIRLTGYTSICSQAHDFLRHGYALWLGGPCIIEVQFPSVIDKQFEFFFQSVRAIEQLDIELFSSVFSLKARCRLTITRDAKRAAVLRRKIKSCFS